MKTKLKPTKQKIETPEYALARHLNCSKDDLIEREYDYYGLKVFSYGKSEYAVGRDEEADEACEQNIKDSVWAFNPDFIASECNMPEAEEIIKAAQQKCESSNDAILAIIKGSCGISSFVQSAIQADGRGHFLSSYDGDEIYNGDGFYIYRTN